MQREIYAVSGGPKYNDGVLWYSLSRYEEESVRKYLKVHIGSKEARDLSVPEIMNHPVWVSRVKEGFYIKKMMLTDEPLEDITLNNGNVVIQPEEVPEVLNSALRLLSKLLELNIHWSEYDRTAEEAMDLLDELGWK